MPDSKQEHQDKIDAAFSSIVGPSGIKSDGPIGMAAKIMADAAPSIKGNLGSANLQDAVKNISRAAGQHSTDPAVLLQQVAGLNLGGLPLSDVQEHAGGVVMSGRLRVSDKLEVHMWLSGDLTRSVGGFVFYKYTGIGVPKNSGWASEWNLDEVITISAYHALSLPELLKQAFISDPKHSMAPSAARPHNQSPVLNLIKNKDELIPSFFHVLRLMDRPLAVVELGNSQLYNGILNDTGFAPTIERNGYRFRTLDIAGFLQD